MWFFMCILIPTVSKLWLMTLFKLHLTILLVNVLFVLHCVDEGGAVKAHVHHHTPRYHGSVQQDGLLIVAFQPACLEAKDG